MPNVDPAINEARRADRSHRRVQRRPTPVTVLRNGVALPDQLVSITFGNGGSNKSLPTGTVGEQTITVCGPINHPSAAVPDTDIKRLDRVFIDGKEYTIENIVKAPGELQAFGTVRK